MCPTDTQRVNKLAFITGKRTFTATAGESTFAAKKVNDEGTELTFTLSCNFFDKVGLDYISSLGVRVDMPNMNPSGGATWLSNRKDKEDDAELKFQLDREYSACSD